MPICENASFSAQSAGKVNRSGEIVFPISIHLKPSQRASEGVFLEVEDSRIGSFLDDIQSLKGIAPQTYTLGPISIHLSGPNSHFFAILSDSYRYAGSAPYLYTLDPTNIHLSPHILSP